MNLEAELAGLFNRRSLPCRLGVGCEGLSIVPVRESRVRGHAGGPSNEGMKQTKPAFFSDCAGFAADPRCSADCQEATT
jgi:hypothetical protein